MPIVVRKFDSNFTTVPNRVISDLCGTPDALALFLVMSSVPHNWEFHKQWLMTKCGFGDTKYRNARKVLVDKGYWINADIRNDKGQLQGSVIWLDPDPSTEVFENHISVKPNFGKQTPLINTKKDNKTNTNAQDDLFDQFYQAYPRHEAKQKALKAFNKLTAEEKQLAIADCVRFRGTERQFIPHPATYLNGKRWQDEKTITTKRRSVSL